MTIPNDVLCLWFIFLNGYKALLYVLNFKSDAMYILHCTCVHESNIYLQSIPDLPCPDLPGTPIYRGHFFSSYTVHLQVFSVKQNPDLPGSPIYQGNFHSPNNAGKLGFDCTVWIDCLAAKVFTHHSWVYPVCLATSLNPAFQLWLK